MASNILVIYAHPSPHQSRVNRRLADAARDLPGVYVDDLYETYPDFFVDVAREQALVEHADLLVFLHPIRWYSMPALLKEWMDVVLEPGWAYGRTGGKLKGKGYWLVVTTGSPAEAYRPEGMHGRPFFDFLAPFEQTAMLCGMEWLPPLVLHGANQADDAVIEAHVATFRRRLERYADASANTAQTEAAFPTTDSTNRSGHGT